MNLEQHNTHYKFHLSSQRAAFKSPEAEQRIKAPCVMLLLLLVECGDVLPLIALYAIYTSFTVITRLGAVIRNIWPGVKKI
ncbi:uncharacterized [Tachysurus ichikawai]